MLASEFVRTLQNLIEAHGDLVVVDDEENLLDIEYSDDGEPMFVVG